MNLLKIVAILDCRRPPHAFLPLTILNNKVSDVDHGFEVVLTSVCLEQGPAEVVFPAAIQEVPPATGADGHLLHCSHPVCPVYINHCLVWLSHEAGQGQTASERILKQKTSLQILDINCSIFTKTSHHSAMTQVICILYCTICTIQN